jgi:serine/threonine protein kinase
MYAFIGKYKHEFSFYRRIKTADPVTSEDLSPEAADLISKLLEKNPRKRLGGGHNGVDDFKKHPFFAVSSLFISVTIQ